MSLNFFGLGFSFGAKDAGLSLQEVQRIEKTMQESVEAGLNALIATAGLDADNFRSPRRWRCIKWV